MRKLKVLFLCTGNSCRSQMAEGLLRNAASDIFEVYSAGTKPKEVHPITISVMGEIGIDISKQRSKDISEYLDKTDFDYVITLCDKAKQTCPNILIENSKTEHWSFEDPAAFQGSEKKKIEKFRQTRDEIKQRITAWILKIRKSM
jgi:arsenate reductase